MNNYFNSISNVQIILRDYKPSLPPKGNYNELLKLENRGRADVQIRTNRIPRFKRKKLLLPKKRELPKTPDSEPMNKSRIAKISIEEKLPRLTPEEYSSKTPHPKSPKESQRRSMGSVPLPPSDTFSIRPTRYQHRNSLPGQNQLSIELSESGKQRTKDDEYIQNRPLKLTPTPHILNIEKNEGRNKSVSINTEFGNSMGRKTSCPSLMNDKLSGKQGEVEVYCQPFLGQTNPLINPHIFKRKKSKSIRDLKLNTLLPPKTTNSRSRSHTIFASNSQPINSGTINIINEKDIARSTSSHPKTNINNISYTTEGEKENEMQLIAKFFKITTSSPESNERGRGSVSGKKRVIIGNPPTVKNEMQNIFDQITPKPISMQSKRKTKNNEIKKVQREADLRVLQFYKENVEIKRKDYRIKEYEDVVIKEINRQREENRNLLRGVDMLENISSSVPLDVLHKIQKYTTQSIHHVNNHRVQRKKNMNKITIPELRLK